MTLEQIQEDGFKIKRSMKNMIVLINNSFDVFVAHRSNDKTDHFTRPLLLGRAQKGFSEAIENLKEK